MLLHRSSALETAFRIFCLSTDTSITSQFRILILEKLKTCGHLGKMTDEQADELTRAIILTSV